MLDRPQKFCTLVSDFWSPESEPREVHFAVFSYNSSRKWVHLALEVTLCGKIEAFVRVLDFSLDTGVFGSG